MNRTTLAMLACCLVSAIILAGCGGGGGGGGGGEAQPPAQATYNYLRAVSIPADIAETGAVAATLSRSELNVNAKISRNSIRMSIAAATQVRKSNDNVYTITSTNYPTDQDYDPTDGIGEQTVIVKYISKTNVNQTKPDANTARIELEASGNTDYEVLKYENATAKYILSNPATTGDWLSVANYLLKLTETA
ncbi:MAG TPA: hypothetical protein PKO06_19485, partial [Candidatus Ozemobacteraceae bacterium]|nr:hypothetical protein [Candidatus Ozemobacteraceae bacterium]